jgi:peptidoglycan/LPS O-acetylase OafA/YrhL
MRLISIQYLRGVAALLIVVYHSFVQLERFGLDRPAPQILSSGVDIFFVISGYIIWHTTSQNNVSQFTFLRHRITRIVPLYWTITTLYLAVLLTEPEWMQGGKYSLYHVIASYLFVATPHPAHPLMMWPLVVAGWSLNSEMFFYLLFTLGLPLSPRMRFLALEAIIFALVGLHYTLDPPINSIWGFYTSSIMLEFGFGIALGYYCSQSPSVPPLTAAALFFAGMFGFAAAATFDLLPSFQGISYGIPSLLVVAGAVLYERATTLPRFTVPRLIGDSSYSLYLTHGAVLSGLAQLWRHFAPVAVSATLNMVAFVLVGLLVATIVGVLTYKAVEQPLLRGLSRKSSERDQRGDFNFAPSSTLGETKHP